MRVLWSEKEKQNISTCQANTSTFATAPLTRLFALNKFKHIVILSILCMVNPRSNKIRTKSVIAFEDIIFKSTQDAKLWNDVSGKEIEYYSEYTANHQHLGLGLKKQMQTTEDRKSMMLLIWKLFLLYLRNDHTLLSLFQRTAGTNWSVKQRMGCFFVYICTIMVATGMYYRSKSTNIWSDIIMSFMISLIATTPGFIIRKLFEYSKPREEQFQRQPSLHEIQARTEGARSSEAGGGGADSDNLEMVVEMRERFYEWMFPFPSYCKIIAWIVLILWAGGCTVTAVRSDSALYAFIFILNLCSIPQIVYGLSFDLLPISKVNEHNTHWEWYNDNDCWNTSLQLRIEEELSNEQFNGDYAEREEMNASGYGGSDSGSWLLSLFQSLMLSIFIWQPLVMMIWTLLCVSLFTWNLPLSIPWSLPALCHRCCCGLPHAEELARVNSESLQFQASTVELAELAHALHLNMSRGREDEPEFTRPETSAKSLIFANDQSRRPVDLLTFLANVDEWTAEGKDVSSPSQTPESAAQQRECER